MARNYLTPDELEQYISNTGSVRGAKDQYGNYTTVRGENIPYNFIPVTNIQDGQGYSLGGRVSGATQGYLLVDKEGNVLEGIDANDFLKRQQRNITDSRATAQQERGLLAEGTQEAQQRLLQGDQFNKRIGYNSPASEAIRSKYMNIYDKENRSFQRQLDRESHSQLSRRNASLLRTLSRESQMVYDNYLRAERERAQRAAARGQVVGTIMGTFGAIVGGPGGAMAGYQAGSYIGSNA